MNFALLRTHPRFRRLWLADLLSQTGSQVSSIALLIVVFRLRSSTAEVAGLVFCQTIPAVIFGLYAGAIIDRFPKKPLLVGADLVRALTVASIPLVSDLWAIYLLGFLTATATAVFAPARQAVIPELVEEESRVNANALSSLTFGVMLFLGPGIGGAIAGFWSVSAAFYIDSATFICSAIFLSGIAISHRAPEHKSTLRTLTKDIGAGMQYVWSHNVIAFVFFLLFIGNVSLGFWFPVLPSFNAEYLHGNNFTFGLIYSAFGLGSLLGGPLAPTIVKRFTKGRIFYCTIALDALCFIIFSLSPSLYFALGISIVWGMVVVVLVVVYETMMQNIIEPEFRGRVFSMGSIQFNGGMLIAQLIAINIAGVLRPERIFLYTGCTYLSLILLASLWKSFRVLMKVS